MFCYLKVRYLTCTLPNVSKDFLSLEDVLWLTIDSHVLRPCRRPPFLLPISRLLFVSMLRSCLALREYSGEREREKNSELLERQKVLFGAKREYSSEKKRKVKFWSKKKQKTKKFLKVSFSLICILLGNSPFFLYRRCRL